MLASYVYVIFNAIAGIISVGQFSMYLSAITTFISTLKGIISGTVDIHQYSDYYGAFLEYTSIEDIYSTGNDIEIPENFIIEFKDVSFGYSGSEHYAIRDLSVKLESGEKIAIVGENGSRKSTFIKLLLRLYEPTFGDIFINGQNIKNVSLESYCNMFFKIINYYLLQ